MNQSDDFFQVNNQVPFQAIKTIKIDHVEIKNDSIHIKSCMTLVRGSQGQYVTLVRNDRQISWLLQNLNNSGQCPLLPKTDCSNMFSQLFGLISKDQPLRAKKLKLLKERVLTRCLTLISTILLQHIRTIGDHYQIPIFIFFHQNFALYHNPIYFKQEQVSLKAKVGNYFWQKYALFTGKGNNCEKLQESKKKLTQERQRLNQITTKLQQYVGQLYKLQEEFISQKERIKKRTVIAEELSISFEMQVKYLDLVIEEAKQTAARAQQQKNQCEKLIVRYGQHLVQECQEAIKANQKLLTQYVKIICENEDKLRIAPY